DHRGSDVGEISRADAGVGRRRRRDGDERNSGRLHRGGRARMDPGAYSAKDHPLWRRRRAGAARDSFRRRNADRGSRLSETGEKRRKALGFIVCLGIVSLFADMTYEGAHSAIGPYLQDLGASVFVIGLVSGFGEMLAASLRFFSGRLADRTHAYWLITMFGYSMNVVAVPALAYVGNWKAAAALVIAERTGKALRGPAREVLLSEATAQVGH